MGIASHGLLHSGLPDAPTTSPDTQFYLAPTYIYGDIGQRNANYRPEVPLPHLPFMARN